MSLHTSPSVHRWEDRIIQVKVPLPFSLKWVNSYLLPDDRGWTAIDPGLNTDEALQTWEAVLAELGIGFSDIHTVLLTHQHPDHYGLAGSFQQRSGAQVYMSERAYRYTQRLWGEGRTFAAELTALYRQHGMPEHLLEQIGPHLESFVAKVSPQPEVGFIHAGQTLRLGGLDWRAIDAPGHATGQLCLYAESRQWMLCGDQVLPDITPNVSIVPGEEDDPLELFMTSLAELAAYKVELAFPGHRNPFTRFDVRIGELLRHHERRLNQMEELLAARPLSGYEMCELLFGARIGGNTHNLRFAMSETLAHLVWLERRGKIIRSERAGSAVYSISAQRQLHLN